MTHVHLKSKFLKAMFYYSILIGWRWRELCKRISLPLSVIFITSDNEVTRKADGCWKMVCTQWPIKESHLTEVPAWTSYILVQVS